MIARRTKVQLAIFVAITLLGVSFVGAKYAKLDRLISDQSYDVVAHFPDSGGIFSGAEVTYRGVQVGQVAELRLVDTGIDVVLEIDNESSSIPADAQAVVANRSAIGEQYVDLQPRSDAAPYLEDGSQIAQGDTRIPLSTTTLLTDVDELVNSVNKNNLRTVVDELGTAFKGAGTDLSTIIDTSNAFIESATDNFATTSRLIRESRPVLRTQLDSEGAIRTFAKNLALFSGTLANSDPDLRRVIDEGSGAANLLRTFIQENRADFSVLINNLLTSGKITAARLDGIELIATLYPYAVEGGFTVVAKDPSSGLYDSHFGLVLTEEPVVCHDGYQSTNKRPPSNVKETPFNTQAHCEEPPEQSSARGAQNSPAYRRSPVVAEYDMSTGKVTPTWSSSPENQFDSADGAQMFGPDSWKWLLLGPMVTK